MQFVIAILVFVVVTMAVFVTISLFDERKSQARVLRDRLSTVQQPTAEAAPNVALLRDEVLSRIPAFDSFLRRSDRVSALQKVLAQGHVDVRAGNFLMLCAASALLLAVIAYIAGGNIIFAWVGVVLGFFLPYAYASHMRKKRFQKFEEKFPEAIDTLARAVRAGHAFTTALEMIANEVSEPVAGEFRQLFEEQKFGLPVRDALLNLADRIPLVDVKFFVTAVMLQRETGGNLAEILDNLSYVIRERFKILRQVRVHTAQGRLTMVLLMALPPTVVVVMYVLNRGFIMPLF
ncbi:MAG: type II secretion system F family protein, partial [Terriglobales bacterium]